MPELPEVETIRRQLEEKIVRKTIIGLSEIRNNILKTNQEKFFELVQEQVIESVKRRAKYLLFELKNTTVILTHLRMTGKYVLTKTSTEQHRHDRLTFHLSEQIDLRFNDVRCFGTIEALSQKETEKKFEKFGKEPLDPELTTKEWFALLSLKISPIKNILLNQSCIAGIGNIYASEALFRSGIHPATPGNLVTYPQAQKLLRNIRQVLRKALKYNGTTISDYRAVDEKTGEFQNFLRVYGKNDTPCYICKTKIQRIKQQQRSTFFCPVCQPTSPTFLSQKNEKTIG